MIEGQHEPKVKLGLIIEKKKRKEERRRGREEERKEERKIEDQIECEVISQDKGIKPQG